MKGWSDVGVEIERKFLVRGDGWRAGATPVAIRQGYLCTQQGTAVRVRKRGREAFLTIKGEKSGLARAEYEYPIPAADADEMLDALCRAAVDRENPARGELRGRHLGDRRIRR